MSSYVQDIDEAIREIRAEHDRLTRMLVAAKGGGPYEDPEEKAGAQFVKVSLDTEHLDALIRIAQLKNGHIEKYPDLAFEMAFVYLVATFDAFLTDIFGAVIVSRPVILKSKKQITYEKLLEFGSTADLVDYLAKRELTELSYKSTKEQTDYYQDRLGVSLVESGVSIDELVDLRSTRNLLVHNNGVVNHIYLEQVAGSRYALGEHVHVNTAYFEAANERLRKVVEYLCSELTTKFDKQK